MRRPRPGLHVGLPVRLFGRLGLLLAGALGLVVATAELSRAPVTGVLASIVRSRTLFAPVEAVVALGLIKTVIVCWGVPIPIRPELALGRSRGDGGGGGGGGVDGRGDNEGGALHGGR